MRYLSRMSRENIQSLTRYPSSLQRYCEYVWRSGSVRIPLRIELPLTRHCPRIYTIFEKEDIFVEIRCRAIDSLSDCRKLENLFSFKKSALRDVSFIETCVELRANQSIIASVDTWSKLSKGPRQIWRGSERKEKKEDRRVEGIIVIIDSSR